MEGGDVRPQTLACLLCGGLISFKNEDQTKFRSHAVNDHDVFFNVELLLALTFLSGQEKELVVELLAPRFSKNESSEKSIKDDLASVIKSEKGRKEKRISKEENTKGTGNSEHRDGKTIYGIPRKSKKLINTSNECRETSTTTDYEEIYVVKESEDLDDDVFTSPEKCSGQERDKSYVRCKVCQKVMKRKSYQQHKLTHDRDDRKFGCNFCETKFRKSEHLMQHVDRCHDRFSRSNIRASITSSSDLDMTLFRCTICSNQFDSHFNLTNHMKEHYPGFKQHLPKETGGSNCLDSKPWKCQLCGKEFSMKYNFKRHLRSSHGERADGHDDSDSYMSMK